MLLEIQLQTLLGNYHVRTQLKDATSDNTDGSPRMGRDSINMDCSIANAKASSAAQALTISEEALQRLKQQGCGTTQRDRAIMQMPDLKALSYIYLYALWPE